MTHGKPQKQQDNWMKYLNKRQQGLKGKKGMKEGEGIQKGMGEVESDDVQMLNRMWRIFFSWHREGHLTRRADEQAFTYKVDRREINQYGMRSHHFVLYSSANLSGCQRTLVRCQLSCLEEGHKSKT